MATLQEVKLAFHRGLTVTKEQLSDLPIKTLQGLDIRTPEQEKIVQEVLDSKRGTLPISQDIYAIARQGIRTDLLKTPEDEAKAQAIINERVAKLRPQTKVETTGTQTVTQKTTETMGDPIAQVEPAVKRSRPKKAE